MSSSNRITKVAIIGAGGNSGKGMATELLATGQHIVTALTRVGSTSALPEGIKPIAVDYDSIDSLVEALHGQDALIITLSVYAPQGTHSKVVQAAAKAGVPWILPNYWCPESSDPDVRADSFVFSTAWNHLAEIEQLGVSSYIAVATGFWYEWSLAIPDAFGFDFKDRRVTLFDDGMAKLTLSTWPQVGRAVAALLSLPIKPENDDEQRALDTYKNKQVCVGSFTVSQQDMFESVLRVTGTTRDQWTTTSEGSHERLAKAVEARKNGDQRAYAIILYSRIFYPEKEVGNAEKNIGLLNEVLGLKTDDLDAATSAAIERSKQGSVW